MSDRKKDDAAPLAPRRPLSGPGGGRPNPSGQHVRTPPPPRTDAPAQRTSGQSGGGGGRPRAAGAGQQTQTMPAVQQERPVIPPAEPTSAQQQARPAKTKPAAKQKPAKSGKKSVRRARLNLVRVDPWSVMKIAFALSVAVAVVTVVAVAIVWSILGAAGVWDAINNSVAVVLENDADGFDVTNYVGLGRVLGLTLVIAAADVVLLTAMATLGAFLYNLASSLLGGLEITLAEDR